MYVHLISTASLNLYSFNTANDFKIKLAKRLPLKPSNTYEIGLVSAVFPKVRLCTSNEIDFNNTEITHNRERNSYPIDSFQFEVVSSTGCLTHLFSITDPQDKSSIIGKMNSSLRGKKQNSLIKFSVNAKTNRTCLQIVEPNISIRLSPALQNILQFDRQLYSMGNHYSTVKQDIEEEIPVMNMYIYCSLCIDSFLGDSLVPLLRIVPVPLKKYSRYVLQFNKIIYTKMDPTYDITQIEIQIRTETGQLVSFANNQSPTVLVLHIREAETQ